MYSIFSVAKGKPRNYFALQRKFFKMLGISFSQTESQSYQVYSAVILFCTIFSYPVLQCCELIKFSNNLDIFSVVFAYASITTIGAGKAIILLRNRKSIGKVLDSFEEGVFVPNSTQEEILIKKCIQAINRQCLLYVGGVYATEIFGIIDSIIMRIRSSNYQDWTFPAGYFSLLDVTHSPNFEIACVYQVVCVTACFGSAMLCDVLIGGILAHISVQCRILQDRIKLMVENTCCQMIQDIPGTSSNTADASKIPWKYLQKTLKETVINHVEIINLAAKFEDQFSYLALMQFLSTSCTMCFTMYYCSLFSMTDFKFIQYMIAIADIAIQVLFYCYWGNEVTVQSLKISEACNEANFVGTDMRFQKGLLLMMLRSQRPIKPTAGKFTTLSLQTYVWILRASYSYYMVIASQK